jgi:hypothetical protein
MGRFIGLPKVKGLWVKKEKVSPMENRDERYKIEWEREKTRDGSASSR